LLLMIVLNNYEGITNLLSRMYNIVYVLALSGCHCFVSCGFVA
jgi:membrane-bound acyltransferase YfiQ involved in biofilm formation